MKELILDTAFSNIALLPYSNTPISKDYLAEIEKIEVTVEQLIYDKHGVVKRKHLTLFMQKWYHYAEKKEALAALTLGDYLEFNTLILWVFNVLTTYEHKYGSIEKSSLVLKPVIANGRSTIRNIMDRVLREAFKTKLN